MEIKKINLLMFIIMTILIISHLHLCLFVLPHYEQIFKRIGLKLPSTTNFLLEYSHFIQAYFYVIGLMAIIISIFVSIYLNNKSIILIIMIAICLLLTIVNSIIPSLIINPLESIDESLEHK